MLSRRMFTQRCLGSLSALALRQVTASPASAAQPALLDPVTLGDLKLPNRVIMAPLTRGRAGGHRTANTLMAEYYAQRSDAGLIIAEATAISPMGYGWVGSPAIYTEQHAVGWKVVTEAIHRRGGRVFLQLWHTGRVSHPDFLGGKTPIAPSAIIATGHTHTPLGKKPFVMPRAMVLKEILGTVRDYARAAQLAREARFDGVEIHAGNGYLIDQFTRDGTNHRTDAYGGSVRNRLRFLLEVTDAVLRVWPAEKVGVRLSPRVEFGNIRDSNPAATFTQAAKALNRFGLSYLHVIEYLPTDPQTLPQPRVAPQMRAAFDGSFILNGGYDAATGAMALNAGEADMIAYGRWYLANPDLVERFRRGAGLNNPDASTFYTSGAQGYTDYSALQS